MKMKKGNKENSEKSSKLKTGLIITGIVLLILISILTFVYLKYLRTTVNVATLNIKDGSVEVDNGFGWQQAVDEMNLRKGDKIRTLENGKALLVLYESILVNLEPNTEISIKSVLENNVIVKQEKGTTWNKFLDIVGIKSYSVETPTTVATVRGTGFLVTVSNDLSEVDVGEGIVTVESDKIEVNATENKKVFKINKGKLLEDNVDPNVQLQMANFAVEDLSAVKTLRMKEIKKYKSTYEPLMKKYNVTEEQLLPYLDKIDSGELNDSELIAKSPIKLPVLTKLKKMNDNIKKQQSIVQRINDNVDKIDTSKLTADQKQKINDMRNDFKREIVKAKLNLKQQDKNNGDVFVEKKLDKKPNDIKKTDDKTKDEKRIPTENQSKDTNNLKLDLNLPATKPNVIVPIVLPGNSTQEDTKKDGITVIPPSTTNQINTPTINPVDNKLPTGMAVAPIQQTTTTSPKTILLTKK